MELLIELASLQTAFLTLDEAIKTTNRRVNALDNVVVPRLENTISYIKVPKILSEDVQEDVQSSRGNLRMSQQKKP